MGSTTVAREGFLQYRYAHRLFTHIYLLALLLGDSKQWHTSDEHITENLLSKTIFKYSETGRLEWLILGLDISKKTQKPTEIAPVSKME